MDSDSERKVNIKTEPTDEEVPEGSSEFFAAIKAHPYAEYVVLAKTPEWLCKKYKINQEDTITRIVGHIPATADSGHEYIIKTVGRASIDSETVKMALDSRFPEVTIGTTIFKGQDTLVKRFLLGGPNPSTPLVLSKASRTRMEILRNMEEEEERNRTGRRIMTRKTIERTKRKNEMMEREKMERRKMECLSFAFQCTYCGHQSNRLTSLKDHVLGTRTKIDRGRCLQIDCINRLIQDGLLMKYEEDAIPVTCPPPKKQPWAKITCKDPKLIDSEGKFDIPEDIAKEWLKFFKDMPT